MTQLSFTDIDDLNAWRLLSAPLWIFDVERQRIWWANESGLKFWHAGSVSELGAREYSTDSTTVVERLIAILDTLPETGSFQDHWTLYPDGEPTTVILSFQRVKLKGERFALLIEVVQIRDTEMDKAATRIAEAAQSTSSMITMMSIDGRVLVQNSAAFKCYGPPSLKGQRNWTSTCAFPTLAWQN